MKELIILLMALGISWASLMWATESIKSYIQMKKKDRIK